MDDLQFSTFDINLLIYILFATTINSVNIRTLEFQGWNWWDFESQRIKLTQLTVKGLKWQN